MCISSPPYFDHNAFIHHPMHVLDAPEGHVSDSRSARTCDHSSPIEIALQSPIIASVRTLSQSITYEILGHLPRTFSLTFPPDISPGHFSTSTYPPWHYFLPLIS